ncbi:MAG: FHA domain-containing protein [Chloroflexi bacterium]|nr:FHA domain-containing protein [Chloroflexota bacterium]
MTSQSYQLMLRVGPEPGKVFELSKAELHVGRDVNNEIMINDAELSRRHARLVSQGGGYVLEDLGSTNGTFVNGKRLSGPHALQPGETIRFGDTVTLSYEIAGFDPNATVASGQAAAPAPAPVAAPPAQPASGYAGQVPAGPDSSSSSGPLANLLGNRSLMIGCAALLVVGACVGIAGLWYIDSNELWCDYFSFLFSACP